ncbi:TOMM precursor leader peptide-binding protein [Sorangium sp. So ce834]|uniref:TOMM precursor leader peptide-binding protein n=1 Tax=Sorangium sp. So ce834 TaxID=3133321 RepID=UPI003F62F18E
MPTTQALGAPASARSAPSPTETSQRLARARVLVVGIEPWGAVAAHDLATAGVGALRLLDSAEVLDDDLLALPLFDAADRGKARGASLAERLSRVAPACHVDAGPLVAAADRPLALEDTRWDLVLTCAARDDLLVMQSVARFAHAAGLASLCAYLDGLDAIIGPGVLPGRTACWSCARLRQLSTREKAAVHLALQAALLAERPARSARTCLAPMPTSLGHSLALAALDMLLRPETATVRGRLLAQNLVSLETSIHAVLPMPTCDVCGGARALAGDQRPERTPSIPLDAARTPDELRGLLAGVVDERTGIVKSLSVNPVDPEVGIEVLYHGVAVLSTYATSVYPDHQHEPDAGAGKGVTRVDAMIGAAGEAIERYAAEHFDERRQIRAPVASMTGDLISPEQIGLYSEEQYAQPGFPQPKLAPTMPIDWVPGRWLGDGGPVWVPALAAHFSYPAPPEERFFQVTSNGLAAGSSHEDAALRATLELVERDAFMLSWLARRPGVRVLLDDAVDLHAREVVRQLAVNGVKTALWLLDVGLSVPVVMCAGFGDGRLWPGAMVSLSAHLSPRLAIRKAIMEHAQGGNFIRRWMEEKTIPERPEDVRTLEDHALYYVPPSRAGAFAFLDGGGEVPAAELAEPEDTSLAALARRIGAAGMRVAIVDVTTADLLSTPFRVARAIGRGFLQIQFGHSMQCLGNQRLRAMASAGFNPDPHPMA